MSILSGKARLAGVIGWPVGHSRSPRLHGYWIDRLGLDAAYLPLPVRPEDFADCVRALMRMGFAGANVTVPHKEAAFALCDIRDAAAEAIGAVNTLVFRDGKICGSNTDAFGFIENLRQSVPVLPRGPALVLGAGGAARAVIHALLEAGYTDLRIANRTRARAEDLCRAFAREGCFLAPLDWSQIGPALTDTALLVNTTSLGMNGQPPLEIDLTPLPTDALVTDIVYVPLETPLLAAARTRGNPVVDGLGMLLHQARPGFAAWFDQPGLPTVDEGLRRFVLG